MENKNKMKIGELEIDLNELADFIVEGKRRGFAGGGIYKTLKDGSKKFIFKKGNLCYEDHFWGSIQAPGYEMVRKDNERGLGLWFMSYSGGMMPEFWGDKELAQETFAFLKEALLQVTPEKPFRGPPKGYKKGNFLYEPYAIGTVRRFSGDECISLKSNQIKLFTQDYHGGLIIPK